MWIFTITKEVILPLDKELFVQNVKKYCAAKGVKPTIACRESGAGINLINKMESRGSIPSVEKVQLLAQYLGITTSELLGEDDPGLGGPAQPYLVMRYNSLSPEGQDKLMTFLEYLVTEESKKNVSDSDTL